MEIDKVEKVHSIGYRLKDAKFTVNHDFKYNVAGMKIELKQALTNTTKRWSENTLSIFTKREQLSKINKRIDELKSKWNFEE